MVAATAKAGPRVDLFMASRVAPKRQRGEEKSIGQTRLFAGTRDTAVVGEKAASRLGLICESESNAAIDAKIQRTVD